MDVTTIERIMERARELNKKKKAWHFHMLTSACMFNKQKNKHAFVLENETDREVFVAYSNSRYMVQGKELVQLLHGKEVLKKTASGMRDGDIKVIIEKAKQFNEKGIAWHHHMLFPDCMFNNHKGEW